MDDPGMVLVVCGQHLVQGPVWARRSLRAGRGSHGEREREAVRQPQIFWSSVGLFFLGLSFGQCCSLFLAATLATKTLASSQASARLQVEHVQISTATSRASQEDHAQNQTAGSAGPTRGEPHSHLSVDYAGK